MNLQAGLDVARPLILGNPLGRWKACPDASRHWNSPKRLLETQIVPRRFLAIARTSDSPWVSGSGQV